ncbi:C-X-C motif chemokine 16 [Loxodonta africana]|nr:C-X-C motif chemokine 16 [Loxodonta africana]
MCRGLELEFRVFLLLLIAGLTLPGDGNEGSVTGSCYCDRLISTPTMEQKEHFRKHLKGYTCCRLFVRFELHSRTVCGGSTKPWVLHLMSCFDSGECGRPLWESQARQKHLPPLRTQVPEPTDEAPSDLGTPALTYLPSTLQSTQQPSLPDRGLTYSSEATTLGVEAGENQKQLEDNVGPPGGMSAMVPVLSLLAVTFILIAVLLYVLCKRRREQSRLYYPDLQFHYKPVAPDSNT